MCPKIIIGFFLCVFAFNAYFTYSAINSQRGLVSETPYEDGLNYDLRKKELTAGENTGWKVDLVQNGNSLILSVDNTGATTAEDISADYEALNLSAKNDKFKGSFKRDVDGKLSLNLKEGGHFIFDLKIKVGDRYGLFTRKIFVSGK
jgi:nitrogen fixation protein FixH